MRRTLLFFLFKFLETAVHATTGEPLNDANKSVCVFTTVNEPFLDFHDQWLSWLSHTMSHHLHEAHVFFEDDASLRSCSRRYSPAASRLGFDYVPHRGKNSVQNEQKYYSKDYNRMMGERAGYALQIMANPACRTIIRMDIDLFVVRDIMQLMTDASADLFVSYDNHPPRPRKAGYSFKFAINETRCGCFVAFRNNERAGSFWNFVKSRKALGHGDQIVVNTAIDSFNGTNFVARTIPDYAVYNRVQTKPLRQAFFVHANYMKTHSKKKQWLKSMGVWKDDDVLSTVAGGGCAQDMPAPKHEPEASSGGGGGKLLAKKMPSAGISGKGGNAKGPLHHSIGPVGSATSSKIGEGGDNAGESDAGESLSSDHDHAAMLE